MRQWGEKALRNLELEDILEVEIEEECESSTLYFLGTFRA